MSKLDIIRAWKDETYRNSLSSDEQAQLPENPAGTIELTETELKGIEGGVELTIHPTPPIFYSMEAYCRRSFDCPYTVQGVFCPGSWAFGNICAVPVDR